MEPNDHLYFFTVDHAPRVSDLIDTDVTDTSSISKGFATLRFVLSTIDCETKDRFYNGFELGRIHPNSNHRAVLDARAIRVIGEL